MNAVPPSCEHSSSSRMSDGQSSLARGSRRAFRPPGLVGARSSLSILYRIDTFVECVQRSALLLHRGTGQCLLL